MLSELYDFLENFDQDQIYLYVTMNYFACLESQDRGTEELFNKIEEMRKQFKIESKSLIIDYTCQAINFLLRCGLVKDSTVALKLLVLSIQLLDSSLHPERRTYFILYLCGFAKEFLQPNIVSHQKFFKLLLDGLYEVGDFVEDIKIQHEVARFKAQFSFLLRDVLFKTPEESLESHIQFASLCIERQQFLAEFFIDTQLIVKRLKGQKMYKTALYLLNKIIDKLFQLQKAQNNQQYDTAIKYFKKEAQNIEENFINK